MPTAHDIPVNGIHLRIYRQGDPAKQSVILLHGITDKALCWGRTANALATDFDVMMVDARGHGDSAKPKSGYMPDDHATDVRDLIEKLALEQPIVIGHSMGADVAATVAAAHPDLLRALILIDPPWNTHLTSEVHAARRDIAYGEFAAGLGQNVDDLLDYVRAENPHWHDDEYQPWAEAVLQIEPAIADYFTGVQEWETIIPKIAPPTLLIRGNLAKGAIVDENVAQYAEGFGWHLAHMPEAGHSIQRDAFDATMDAVRVFLSQIITPVEND